MKENKITSWVETTIGYSESAIARGEKNDCVVLSFANAFKIHYDTAHHLVKTKMKRPSNQGVDNFVTKMNGMVDSRWSLGDRWLNKVGTDNGRGLHVLTYPVKVSGSRLGLAKMRDMTVGTFIKKYPKGTYIVVIKRHAFTIIDGVICGNPSDSIKLKRRLYFAWEVCDLKK
jgi:hypothetical protein